MEVNIRWNVTNFATVDSDLISQHARSRNLDGIWPVVVVVAQSISEVQDGILRNERGVLSNIEMSRLDCSLGHGVRNEEKVEPAFNDFGLFNESVIHIGTLRWIQDMSGVRWAFCLLKESLSHALIDDDECDLRESVTLSLGVVFVG